MQSGMLPSAWASNTFILSIPIHLVTSENSQMGITGIHERLNLDFWSHNFYFSTSENGLTALGQHFHPKLSI